MSEHGSSRLSIDEVQRVAQLSRLALGEAQLSAYRDQLGAVLVYIDQLRALDLEGVEPMAHAGDTTNRMDDDEPRPGLPTEALMNMAPESHPPFIRVPKVLGGESGA